MKGTSMSRLQMCRTASSRVATLRNGDLRSAIPAAHQLEPRQLLSGSGLDPHFGQQGEATAAFGADVTGVSVDVESNGKIHAYVDLSHPDANFDEQPFGTGEA